jgi:hypothetical protein
VATVQVTGEVSNAIVKPRSISAVWIKRNWNDRWQYVPYLSPRHAVEEDGSGRSQASLLWHYGMIKQHDLTAFRIYSTLDIQNWFVGIDSNSVFGAWKVWIGIINSENLNEFSVSTDLSEEIGEPFLFGDQEFGAVGLEYLLQRRRINGTFGPNGIFIDRTVVFNRRYERGASFEGNRSTSRDSDNVFVFSEDNEVWNYRDILQYVVKKFGPPGIDFEFWGLVDHLSQFTGTFDFEGMRIWDVLNTLIDNRRGFGWRILTRGEGVIGIYVFSTLKDPIAFGGFTIPRNTWQDIPIFDDLIDVHPDLQVSQAHSFDRVVVRGARLKTCMSLSFINNTLEAGWTSTEQTDYEAATDKERATDKFDRVFSLFRVPGNWQWAFLSLANATAQNANPTVNFDGTVNPTEVGTFFNQGHRFLNFLPFEVEAADTDAEPEFRRPFVIVENPDETDEYHYSETLSPIDLNSYRLRMAEREFGLVLKSKINHLIGLNFFSATEPTEFEAEADLSRMVATVFFETDAHLQVDMNISTGQNAGRGFDLLLNVPDAEYWFVAGGTVSDVTDGVITFNNGGNAEAVRDDGDKLRALAAAARAWYGGARNIISYRFDGIAPFHPVGMMIRGTANVANEFADVGTVVTRRRWDFERDQMFVETGFSGFNIGATAATRASGNATQDAVVPDTARQQGPIWRGPDWRGPDWNGPSWNPQTNFGAGFRQGRPRR